MQNILVLLDEGNTTSSLWTTKDILCDRICCGVRIPENIVFVVIVNPWTERTEAQKKAIREMDQGGLNFLKYQQSEAAGGAKDLQEKMSLDLVYQVPFFGFFSLSSPPSSFFESHPEFRFINLQKPCVL